MMACEKGLMACEKGLMACTRGLMACARGLIMVSSWQPKPMNIIACFSRAIVVTRKRLVTTSASSPVFERLV